MTVFCLVYVSRAVSDFPETALHELMAKSRSKNVDKSITGVLLMHEGYFLQMLEGDRSAIQQLMAVIATDRRHDHVTVVFENTVERRHCPDWSMLLLTSKGENTTSSLEKINMLQSLGNDLQGATLIERESVISDLFCRFMTPLQWRQFQTPISA